MDSTKHTCLKLQLPNKSQPDQTEPIFVKATWFSSRFDLSITDGLDAWTLNATEDEVRERASQWDQPVSEYIELAERHLGFQQPGSVYGFADAGNGHRRVTTEDEVRERASQWDQPVPEYIELAERHLGFQQPGSVYGFADAGNGHRRLSWTFEKEGTKLEWRWKCKLSPDREVKCEFLSEIMMREWLGLLKLSAEDEVVKKTQSFERLKVEAEKCLAQSEKFSNEKAEFEAAIYAKFLGVLNSKKAKLRDLRDQLSKQEKTGKLPQEEEEEEFTDKTETFDGESDNEKSKDAVENRTGTSKYVPPSKPRGRKRK
ncbi:hypothetical protein TEA_003220 [Camellia sinensis var. sinensis]|uniref:DNA repair protein XRCC4 n=1 Tax=Camellia sinensis var. sinensis TaxID=542762 RepID=A0A4S4DWQ8_CAMSN|nr:hypothetical protein TEA_003220 [Camellia sinensis var. sinensis]